MYVPLSAFDVYTKTFFFPIKQKLRRRFFPHFFSYLVFIYTEVRLMHACASATTSDIWFLLAISNASLHTAFAS